MIFAASATPADRLPAGQLWQLDKLIHAGIYAVLGALSWRAVRGRAPHLSGAVTAAIAIGLAAAYAVTDELHQRYVPGRHASVGDLVADVVGAATACGALVYLWSRRVHHLARTDPSKAKEH